MHIRRGEMAECGMDNNIGKKLDGRYELLELIGVGGMADIYKAKDITEDKIVAVKILKNEFVGSEDFIRRFRNESKAIALLSHPNIVKIFDVGFTEKLQFIVMEYIDGITLTEYIAKQGVLKWRDVVHFTMQILKALQHAHDRGIVHRDIKPQNVMLLNDGTIKVMDFGIARFNRETDKTVSEKAIGSVHYISPEQARGDVTDERSDIYSIGVMMYEMLTGKKPFDGDSPVAIALMHMQSQAKKMSEINNAIPEGLEEITEKAMQKEPAKRYQTAGEMMKDIEEFKKNPSIVFEYKYFSTDGTTKYFDRVAPEPKLAESTAKERDVKRGYALDIDEDEDEDEDEYDDEVAPRRSPLLSILFAVTAVFVIVAVLVVYKIVSDVVPTEENNKTEEVVVPTFIGLTDEELEDRYGSSFRIRLVSQNDPAPKGQVIDQSIGAGTSIKSTQLITVTVSLGPKMEEIGNYASRPSAEAKTQLENLGFKTEILKKNDEDIPLDYVISTDPPANTRAEIGTTVTIVVSLGPSPSLTVVPDFKNLTEYYARQNAERNDINLIVDYKPSENPETEQGRVISQSIEPNTKVEKGTVVTIVVANGEPLTVERTSSIDLSINSDISGEFNFRYYIDGNLVPELNETRDISLNKSISWEVTGTGTHDYTIMIENPKTGERKALIRYDINFDEDPPTKEQIAFNPNVFSELSAAEETTADSVETEPPSIFVPEDTTAAETEPAEIPTEQETQEPIAEL